MHAWHATGLEMPARYSTYGCMGDSIDGDGDHVEMMYAALAASVAVKTDFHELWTNTNR